ncbi:probable indole-3-pyruvate monooxygenase YUCCA11 [Dioscorea cayenensis subsp. rotundata]|uniref:Flavin-containing monooxygenase n=1 Tax=Dioscorea cayennensis subsp. rotundata TaxID=55577 RepID=A0AB40BED5_DIOCR|nr:probable indole-3-pyruvate monooxygenase YUCCA11 [Dioscorea cayenensis subsp. rotundata]
MQFIDHKMKKEVAVIIGAGPAGIATAACLNNLSIPNIILEKDDCIASLWKKRSYDRLKLHLAKQFCSLPLMPLPHSAPTFISKAEFIGYLDNYVEHFKLHVVYCTEVVSAALDENGNSWIITVSNRISGKKDEYSARFLIVATGENSEKFIPEIHGLKSFSGEVIHSSEYRSGEVFSTKNVLVVGSGNSGMEIAYDLSKFGARTSIAVRSPFHVMSKETIHFGMVLMKYFPVKIVDVLLVMLAKFKYGNLSKYGIVRPKNGPLKMKAATGRSAVIDVGTVDKIKSGEITVVKAISRIRGDEVISIDGSSNRFDVIIFATGYRSTANTWLKDGEFMLNETGMPKQSFPEHWKGRNGLYCAGLSRRGLPGVSMDAQNIANHINMVCLLVLDFDFMT